MDDSSFRGGYCTYINMRPGPHYKTIHMQIIDFRVGLLYRVSKNKGQTDNSSTPMGELDELEGIGFISIYTKTEQKCVKLSRDRLILVSHWPVTI